MTETENYIKQRLHELDFIEIDHGPKNMVLVTTDDVVELMHQIMPYTLSMEERWKST